MPLEVCALPLPFNAVAASLFALFVQEEGSRPYAWDNQTPLVQKAGIEPAPHCILFGDLHIAPFSATHYHCETSVYYDEVREVKPV